MKNLPTKEEVVTLLNTFQTLNHVETLETLVKTNWGVSTPLAEEYVLQWKLSKALDGLIADVEKELAQ